MTRSWPKEPDSYAAKRLKIIALEHAHRRVLELEYLAKYPPKSAPEWLPPSTLPRSITSHIRRMRRVLGIEEAHKRVHDWHLRGEHRGMPHPALEFEVRVYRKRKPEVK